MWCVYLLLKHGSDFQGDTHCLCVITIVAARTVKLYNFAFEIFFVPFSSSPSFLSDLQPAPFARRPSRAWLLCIGAVVLFVPLLPWLPARRLAAPCVKGGQCGTDCGNSRLASPCPLLRIQRGSYQSSAPPAPAHTLTPNQTHTRMKSLQHSHPLPIILGSNFISTRVAAHCRQPLNLSLLTLALSCIRASGLISPTFQSVLLPALPGNLHSLIPVPPPPAAPPRGALTAFSYSNLPITYLQGKVGALTPCLFWRQRWGGWRRRRPQSDSSPDN